MSPPDRPCAAEASGHRVGLKFCIMYYKKPKVIRVNTYFDGQNLFKQAEKAFSYKFPNYDPIQLSEYVVSEIEDAILYGINFYTGIHDPQNCPSYLEKQAIFWNQFWANKLAILGNKGVNIFTKPLKYRREGTRRGRKYDINEKGIDVKIAIDIIEHAEHGRFDHAIIFSTDSDLIPAIDKVKRIRGERNIYIEISSAFIYSPDIGLERGIEGINWIKISRNIYDKCIDPNDYRVPFPT